MVKHLNIKIFGRVQGVFFRSSAQEEANKLRLSGFARNEPDGSVYIEVEGDEESIKKFLAWCKSGPEAAEVEKIESKESKLKNFPEFSTN